jgi:hypothetical protein
MHNAQELKEALWRQKKKRNGRPADPEPTPSEELSVWRFFFLVLVGRSILRKFVLEIFPWET